MFKTISQNALPGIRRLVVLFALVLFVLTAFSVNAQSGSEFYYYYQGTRIPLAVSPDRIAVRFAANVPSAIRRELTRATNDITNIEAGVESPVGGLVFLPLRPGADPLVAVNRFESSAGIDFVSPVYEFDNTELAETGEFLARFPANLSDADIASINREQNVALVGPVPNSDRVFRLKPNAGTSRSARELANTYVEAGLAEFAEPDFVLRTPLERTPPPLSANSSELAPNDGNFGLQWGLRNTQQFLGSIAGADVKATDAWNVTRGSSSLIVAVIDEGVFASHPELSGKVLPGYNAMNGSSNTTPKTNDHHGTAVAGVIGAQSDNGSGMAGLCWFCQILPVKVAETDSQGNWVTSFSILASGIDWAWQNGADVLNNSWTTVAPSDTIQLAIINARFSGRNDKGSTLVFASGNQDSNIVSFPASLNSYVIAVGASNWCDQRKVPTNNPCNNNNGTWGSNYGTALDLVAPGEAIYTTCNGNQCSGGTYTYISGTSLAAPLVSGAAALIYSLNPNLGPDQVQSMLQNAAKDLGPAGRDNETGYGRLDAFRALGVLYNVRVKVKLGKKFVRPGETIEYKIKYFNTGNAAMGDTKIFVKLPSNTTYVSSTPGFVSQGGGNYRLDLGSLPSNATGTALFRVQVQPSAAGQAITLTANITGAFPEFNTNDNASSKTVLGVKRQVNLPLIKFLSP